jgi:tRNA-splicing ligase RtcB (3'-phosphate/5'-hydroxy nucleic acid ligase)
MARHQEIESFGGVPIKAWIEGVPLEDEAAKQLRNVARLPIVGDWIAVMPDVHLGYGATVGSVIPTVKAVIPAAVGVDIGCGMVAMATTLKAEDLPDDLSGLRSEIERAVPHGFSRGRGRRDKGSFENAPTASERAWASMEDGYRRICAFDDRLDRGAPSKQLGTLGGGNHFIEICLDEANKVWVMLHSGSRGVGNRIGRHFIELARDEMLRLDRHLPDRDLGYFEEGAKHFDAYVFAVEWAQEYARTNRDLMMASVLGALRKSKEIPSFQTAKMAVNCHHNYVTREVHFGREVFVTRKGAVRAGKGELGIIPGSMGAKSFIVRGKGNAESFESCSHGAGRVMSRTKAKKIFSVEDHALATEGVECRKDEGVIDETPAAYKSIDAVMAAQDDLVEIVHTLKQVVCVKG